MMAHMLSIWIIGTLLVMILSLFFFPKLTYRGYKIQSYWLIAIAGAIGVLFFQSWRQAFILAAIFGDGAINPLRMLSLFFALTILATYLDEVGFIRYLAYQAMHIAKKNQRRLFFIWYACIALATIVTANDIVILTLTPFIIYFSRHTKVSPLPYLVSQFVAANTWSMLLIIGNPTNIYIASMFDVNFIAYMKVMIFPTIITGFTSMVLLYALFHRYLKTPLLRPEMVINPPHASYRIGLAMLVLAMVMMALAQSIQIPMDTIAIIGAVSLVGLISIFYPRQPYLRLTLMHLPYPLLPFLLSMAILVAGINTVGWSDAFSQFLDQLPPIFNYGVTSFLFSNIMNNIPMTLWFVDLIQASQQPHLPAIFATIIGSNLGALLSPIGALAGLMWLHILKEKQVDFGLRQFLFYGVIVSTTLLLVSLVALDVILP
jgi:arsenical pump membrane protein